MARLCVRCRRRQWSNTPAARGRKLCGSCYAAALEAEEYEPTAEEVEATVAEQAANLPGWWAKETAMMRRLEREDRSAV